MRISRAEYLAKFQGNAQDKTLQSEALKQALDIRKFEIDTYWKRGTYFWTLIAAAFAAFFVLIGGADAADAYLVSCLGTIFSIGWYFSNRGSSAWQRNWEAHVDLLEDEITGPLHKSVINNRTYSVFDLAGPFAFSPSRINTIISLLVALAWIVVLVRTLCKVVSTCSELPFVITISVVSATALFALCRWGTSSPSDQPKSIDLRTRTYL